MKKLSLFCLFFFISLSAFADLKPLPVNQAFSLSASARDSQTILVHWHIAPGYYLYRDRIRFSAVNAKQNRLAQPLFPSTKLYKIYPDIGKLAVYEGRLTIPVPIIQSEHPVITIKAHYQGCSEGGFCYPPTTRVLQLNLSGPYNASVKPIAVDLPREESATEAPLSVKEDRITQLLNQTNAWAILVGFWLFGFLISLTPCVLPMIPILSSIIVGQGEKKAINAKRGFALSLAYVLGMAITYAAAGVVFGLLGRNVQAALQQPWIIILFSLLFIAMALSLFGLFNFQLPEALRSRLTHISNQQKSGSYCGVALMGVLSTLLLSPCVTPPLVGVLGYISQTGNALLGGMALGIMGFGMGTPLLLIGASSAKLLPKAGAWMNTIKNLLGVLMVALAIWILERILPATLILALWALLALSVSIGLGAFSSVKGLLAIAKKTFGILLFIYSLLLSINFFVVNTDPLHPLLLFQETKDHTDALAFTSIKTLSDLNRALEASKKTDRIVVLDFYADWCLACKAMDHLTFNHPDVKKQLKQMIALRADVTQNNAADQALQKAYGVVAPPTVLFFYRGHEIKNSRVVGEVSAKAFLQHLQNL